MKKSLHSLEQEKLKALLRKIRKEKGLRQSELAARLGRSQSFVSKYESGELCLDLLELRTVCQAMDTSLSSLVKRFEKEIS